MDTLTRRILFLTVCIPLRILLVYFAYVLYNKYKLYLFILKFIIFINLLILYFFNLRLHAPEGGGNTWWAPLRLLHGLLYISASIYSIQDPKYMSIPLQIDVTLGFTRFIYGLYFGTQNV